MHGSTIISPALETARQTELIAQSHTQPGFEPSSLTPEAMSLTVTALCLIVDQQLQGDHQGTFQGRWGVGTGVGEAVLLTP